MEDLLVVDRRGGTTVVALDDATLRQGLSTLRWHLDEVLDPGPPVLVVDIAGLRHLSSVTVAVLLRAKRQCRARGGRVVLRGPSRSSLDVLQRTGLSPLFEIAAGPAGTR